MEALQSIEQTFRSLESEIQKMVESRYKEEVANLKEFRKWLKTVPYRNICAILSSDSPLLLTANEKYFTDKTNAESTLKDSLLSSNGTMQKGFVEPKVSQLSTSCRPKRSAAIKSMKRTCKLMHTSLHQKLRKPSPDELDESILPLKRKSDEYSTQFNKKQKVTSSESVKISPSELKRSDEVDDSAKVVPVQSSVAESNVEVENIAPNEPSLSMHKENVVPDTCAPADKTDKTDVCPTITQNQLLESVTHPFVVLSPWPPERIEKFIGGHSSNQPSTPTSEIKTNELSFRKTSNTNKDEQNDSSKSPVTDVATVDAKNTLALNKTVIIDNETVDSKKQSPVVVEQKQSNPIVVQLNDTVSCDIFNSFNDQSNQKVDDAGTFKVPDKPCDITYETTELERSKRTRTKTKKFQEWKDESTVSSSNDRPKRTRTKTTKPEQSETNVIIESDSIDKMAHCGEEIKDISKPNKEESREQTDEDGFKIPLTKDALLPSLKQEETAAERPVKTRTKTLKKAVNENLPVVDVPERTTRTRSKMLLKAAKANEDRLEAHDVDVNAVKTNIKIESGSEEQLVENEEPGVRTRTRTKVKERVQQLEEVIQNQVKSEVELPKTVKVNKTKASPEDAGKENLLAKAPTSIERHPLKGTPLANSNRIFSPFNLKTLTSVEKLKHTVKVVDDEIHLKRIEEAKKKILKEEEALRKKNEIIKAQTEELRRKREMKLKKAAAAREAEEREKLEHRKKLAREKEEKERAARLEKEKLKETMLLKKRMNQQKAQEAEERRLKEESLRIAKQKEIEVEQRRLAEFKLKMQLEAERLQQERLAEKAKEAKLFKEQMLEKSKMKLKTLQKDVSYDMTPPRTERPPLPPKNHNDYGIDDLNSSDSSEDEQNPKKKVPTWALKANRQLPLMIQFYLPARCKNAFMKCVTRTPNLTDIFGENVGKRVRTSSAVWRTPPNLSINIP